MDRALDKPHAHAARWDRYFQANVDLEPILATPGLPQTAFGEAFPVAGGSFVQRSKRGFFLAAEEPLDRDPAELGAQLTGVPSSGAFATLSGTRRRRVRQSNTGTHVQVENLIRGARVVGSGMRFHQNQDGIFAITGRPLGEIASRDPGQAPSFDDAAALETCAQRFEVDEGLYAARVEQVVFPEGDGAVWAYEVGFVVPEHAADVRVYLRAEDHSVLLSYNIASSASGRAQVHPVNPLRTPELEEAEFTDLDEPGNFLRSPSLDIRQGEGVRLDRSDGDFTADPSESAFDEGQVYFHLSRIWDYFATILGAGLLQERPFRPMVATVNDPQTVANATYSPSTGELSFGLIEGRSFARSAAIAYHEFGHAVTDAICELGRAVVENTESRGLSEGFSDYFAAATLNDPRFGDYVANNPEGARNCADPNLRFPAGFVGEEHETGAVWAAVLWAIRQRIDSHDADMIAIESVNFLNASSSFENARSALHAADTGLNGGANQEVIDEEFNARAPE